jgi:nucleotide-binding universal stress UspA family protein
MSGTTDNDRTARVVAGFDGSDRAGVAVEWAADEAARRGAPLRVVYAADYTGLIGGPFGGSWLPENIVREAEHVAEEGARVARRRQPGIEVTRTAYAGGPASALIKESRGSGLVVVGARGRGELAALVLGSVSAAVTAHAHAPVVVVRGGEAVAAGPDRPVVVGVDGSPAAGEALRFALEAARAGGAELKIVGVWVTLREDWVRAYWAAAVPTDDPEREARQAVEKVVADAADRAAELAPDVKVLTYPRGGGPAEAILAVAGDDAGLVVVGSRGLGNLAGLVLGSVGHGVVHGARCPVAVVRRPE